MKKEVLETFIRRYTLGGEINKTKWKYIAAEKTLHTRASADNRSFVVDVIMHDFIDFGTEDVTVCIGDTSKVKGMLSPFGDDFNLIINKQGDRILGFTVADADCESYCTCADPTSLDPIAKNLNDVPEYHVVVPLTEEFLEKFLKARTALKDVDSFSVGMNKKGLFEIVIGYATSNSNRIRITPTTDTSDPKVKNKLDVSLAFPIKNIVEVFKAHADIPNGTLSINEAGIARMYFKNDKYTCTFFQFANKKV
jgi:hypothetical protein